MAELEARITGDSRQFVRSTKQARDELGRFTKQGDVTANKLTAAFSGITLGMAALDKAIGGLTRAFDALYEATATAVEFAKEQERAERKLTQVLESTGHAAGMTRQEMFDLAESLQMVTNFGDETIINAQAMLATFTNIGRETFPQAIRATLDMASVFGTDLRTAVIQLGKALNEPTVGLTALRRIGVSFTQQQIEQIKVMEKSGDLLGAQRVILDELKAEFGGVAEATREPLVQLKNRLGDVVEVIGQALLPTLRSMAEATNEWADQMARNADAIKGGITGVLAVFEGLFEGVFQGFGISGQSIAEFLTKLGVVAPAIRIMAREVASSVLGITQRIMHVFQLIPAVWRTLIATGQQVKTTFIEIGSTIIFEFASVLSRMVDLVPDWAKPFITGLQTYERVVDAVVEGSFQMRVQAERDLVGIQTEVNSATQSVAFLAEQITRPPDFSQAATAFNEFAQVATNAFQQIIDKKQELLPEAAGAAAGALAPLPGALPPGAAAIALPTGELQVLPPPESIFGTQAGAAPAAGGAQGGVQIGTIVIGGAGATALGSDPRAAARAIAPELERAVRRGIYSPGAAAGTISLGATQPPGSPGPTVF